MSLILILAFVVAAQAQPVIPLDQPVPGNVASEKAKADDIVCKAFPPPLGSRIGPRRICKRASEWDFIRAQEQEALEASLRKPYDGK